MGCVLAEIQFTLRFREIRNYDFHLGWLVLLLVKLNNICRMATYSGALVTSQFYITMKLIWLFVLTFIINLIALIILIGNESKIQTQWYEKWNSTYTFKQEDKAEDMSWEVYYGVDKSIG